VLNLRQRLKSLRRRRTGLLIAGGLAFLLAVFLYSELTGYPRPVPAFEQIKGSHQKSDAFLLDRNGEVIHELRVDDRGRRLDWISLPDISPALVRAVCRVEDRRFHQHHGVDWCAVAAAAVKNPFAAKRRGASTITMQLAAIVDKGLKPKAARRNVLQKKDQMLAALEMEKTWSKGQILEAYLNLITYRGELQGVAAASRGLFGKDPSGLDNAESYILASLITSPSSSIGETAGRACLAAQSDKAAPPDICSDIRATARERLGVHYAISPIVADAPHAARKLLKDGATSVRSTLDGRLQRFAAGALGRQLSTLKGEHVFDGAVIVADNRTGEILAYVGNSGSSASAPFVDGVTSLRQVGSTLKPFLYELALEKKYLTAASIIEDSPLNIATPTGLYVPQNYDKVFRGNVTVRSALSASMNVPAVKALLLVGVGDFHDRLRKLGIRSLTQNAEYYGYSLALGSADISLYELTNAYRTLANGGAWSELKLAFDRTGNRRRVIDANAAFIISSILSDREARSATFGLENPLSTKFWTAAKTGTSKDMRDNWCIGYSDRYTVGVWVGNFSGRPMRNVSGVTGAAPVWLEIMNYLHADRPSVQPPKPGGVVLAGISFDSAESSREEFFLRGTEPVAPVRVSAYQKPRITYPVDEMMIAIDPEIPEDAQFVPFRFEPEKGKFQWMINGKPLASASSVVLWKPQRGSYELAIVDKDSRTVDSVSFSVK
jgi:penicillin-binding protein 1C